MISFPPQGLLYLGKAQAIVGRGNEGRRYGMGSDERFAETVARTSGAPARTRLRHAAAPSAPSDGPSPPTSHAIPATDGRSSEAPALPVRLRGAANPLLAAAAPLLDRAAQLRDRVGHGDPEGLRGGLLAGVRRFAEEAAAAGLPPEEVRLARYALCATLDDVVGATPWGRHFGWPEAGLSAQVDREAGGPDRFYELLDTMLGDPRLHRRELELFYACLSLGFEGKFRDRPRGARDHAHLRDELYRVLRRLQGEAERSLSPHWQGVAARFRPLGGILPAWPAAVVTALALGGLFAALFVTLDARTDAVVARLAALLPDRAIEIVRVAPPPPPEAGPALAARVAAMLQPEIRSGAVAVLAGDDGALVIRVEGAGMFAVGRDVLRARYRAVLDRVGQALAPERGRIVVVAHTDDRTPRGVPLSNPQALTDARALAVRTLLERLIDPARLRSEGHGDREPIAPNTTAANRDANRRVDIRFYPE